MLKLVSLEKENAFINAEVIYRNSTFYIVKINEKTIYISPNKDFIKMWENRPKGIIWKNFCKKYNAIMVKYDTVFINEIELLKGKKFIIPASKKTKRYLKPHLEKIVKNLFKRFQKEKGNWKFPIENTDGKKAYILRFHPNGQALIHFENDFFFYDLILDNYTFYKKLGQKRETKIITWPRNESLPKEIVK